MRLDYCYSLENVLSFKAQSQALTALALYEKQKAMNARGMRV